MIVVKLCGGLGNQMFQYAVARHLAEKNSTVLKFDLSFFKRQSLRTFDLHCFYIQADIASQPEVDAIILREYNQFEMLTRKLLKFPKNRFKSGQKLSKNMVATEKKNQFDPSILQMQGDIYLDGYWQSEKYFTEIQTILFNEFTIKYQQDMRNKKISQQILNTDSISLHIRRGDYIENHDASKVHGLCSLDYYHRCIKYICKTVKHPYFFLFSDDPVWVKENFRLDFPTVVVDHNDTSKSYEDLRLMSQCKHNITANSSFSWWGAWLNRNPEKIVCAPKNWFRDSSINIDDLIPDQWIRL